MTVTQQWRLALDAERDTRINVWSDIQGHLPFLYERATTRSRPRLLELGVRSGTSTAVLLAAAEATGGHLWSVDLEPPWVPSWWSFTGRWTLTIGDDLAPEVVADQPEGIDLLLVDTVHDNTAHTLAELRIYVPQMVPGGVVCCHDTLLDPTTVHQAVPQVLPAGAPPNPVAAALDTYCAETGLSWMNRTGSYGMGVIEIPG